MKIIGYEEFGEGGGAKRPRVCGSSGFGGAGSSSKVAFVVFVENRACGVTRRMKNELNFPPNFERLVLGCIDADVCK